MILPLFRHELRSCLFPTAIIAAVVVLYACVIIGMYDPELGESLALMRDAMPELFAAFGMADQGTTLLEFVVNYLHGFLLVVLPLVLVAVLTSRLVVRHVECGSIAYLLAQPVGRARLMLSQAGVLILCLVLLAAVLTVFELAVAQAMFPGELAVMDLVALGTGFPAIHSDKTGYQMLKNLGYDTEDARDWNNCGCVVPHFRKTFEWTSTVNVNFSGAFEYATNGGKSRMTGKQMGLPIYQDRKFASYEDVEKAFMEQFDNLIDISVTGTLIAQRLQKDMIPRPYFSALFEDCLEKGKDLVDGGAKYNVGPVLTGIGLAESANSLAAIKKLVFEDKVCTMDEILDAMDKNWEGYEELRKQAQNAPKYGNDDDFVDDIAQRISNHFYEETHKYTDIYGNPFTSAFMGISNFIPTGRVIGATACGRKAGEPISEGVSPVAGTDTSTPLAAMNSCAKMNQDVHSGGTLLNMRLSHDLVKTKRGRSNLAAMVQTFFDMGAFHVQFNTLSTETLIEAQKHPEDYKDLLVRVAGYSTQFVHLSKTLQDSIIRRSVHDGF